MTELLDLRLETMALHQAVADRLEITEVEDSAHQLKQVSKYLEWCVQRLRSAEDYETR